MGQVRIIEKTREGFDATHVGDEASMPQFETQDMYLKLCIQFCYITMFSVQWPLCALCGLLNNIVQIQCNHFCLMFLTRRCVPEHCPEGIGMLRSHAPAGTLPFMQAPAGKQRCP